MAKVSIEIDEKSFDEEIGNQIKAKVRNVLRNDKHIAELIEEEISRQVTKRVEMAMYDVKGKDIVAKAVKELTQSHTSNYINAIANEVYLLVINNPLLKAVVDEHNKLVIKDLFKKEVEQLKQGKDI